MLAKSIELITSRKHATGFNRMIEIHKFCEERFGKYNNLATWDTAFTNHTDDWVSFIFWNEEYATFLKLVYPDLMTREEFDSRRVTEFDH